MSSRTPSRRNSASTPASRKGSRNSQITFTDEQSARKGNASRDSSKSSVRKSVDKGKGSRSSKTNEMTALDISEIKRPEDETRPPPESYSPMPYTFRLPEPQNSREVKNGSARCPPYHLQLDHTLAVIWALFSQEQMPKPLGIAQLQWALTFLKGIRNRKGEHPKDVALCIETIQDELIEQYSEMVDEVQHISDKTHSKRKQRRSMMKTNFSSSEASFDNTNLSEASSCDSTTCTAKAGMLKPDSSGMITKKIPFSINYSDMVSRSPPGLEQLYSTKGSSCSAGGPCRNSLTLLDSDVSRDNMVGFLKAWRREQVEKIQSELKRLRSIETFIGNVETENFSPYLDNQQLDDLVAEKLPKMSGSSVSQSKRKK